MQRYRFDLDDLDDLDLLDHVWQVLVAEALEDWHERHPLVHPDHHPNTGTYVDEGELIVEVGHE